MSVSPRFFDYLNRFGETHTIAELHDDRSLPDAIGLRHDVDHDLDLALELAYWEHDAGLRATYYLLHTADYWRDPRLIDKCLQLQDFGHEVGLHLNVLTEWCEGLVDDVPERLQALLQPLRDAGVRVVGIAAHGDAACYQYGFVNYWCFEELVGNAAKRRAGLAQPGGIVYPESGELRRPDGAVFPLGSLTLASVGLTHHASHVRCDVQYSDSGGTWQPPGDPLVQLKKKGRAHVLMHPVYWRGAQQIHLFMSAPGTDVARLARTLASATPCSVATGASLPDPAAAAKRRAWIDSLGTDHAELGLQQSPLGPAFADSSKVHLIGDPRAALGALVNGEGDAPMSFAQACAAWRGATESLVATCGVTFDLRALDDRAILQDSLRGMGIAFYDRLAGQALGIRTSVELSETLEAELQACCGPTLKKLQTSTRVATPRSSGRDPREVTRRFEVGFGLRGSRRPTYDRCVCVPTRGAGIVALVRSAAAHVLFGGGAWSRLFRGDGFVPDHCHRYFVTLKLHVPREVRAELVCLGYDAAGAQIHEHPIGVIIAGASGVRFRFRVPSHVDRFNVALRFSDYRRGARIRLQRFVLASTYLR